MIWWPKGFYMNAVVQKFLQVKPLHYTVELSSYVSCCQYHIYGSIVLLEGRIEPVDTSEVKNEMENDISDQKNSKNNAGSVWNFCKYWKQIQKQIASWPMFITCSSLLAQHFPSNIFGDPVKSLPPPSVPYFMTAPLFDVFDRWKQ